MTRRTLLVAICFPALAFFFEGRFGLIAGAAAAVAWWGLALPTRVLWGASVLLMAGAPAVLIVQGLPRTKVVGAGFGVQHLGAHHLVVLSLILATLAALTDLLDLDLSRRRRPLVGRRLRPDRVAVSTVPAQPADRDELGPDDGPKEPSERPEA